MYSKLNKQVLPIKPKANPNATILDVISNFAECVIEMDSNLNSKDLSILDCKNILAGRVSNFGTGLR
ncbi:hypothetical protein EUGRSUZ_B01719 [Eucalyptus grandis]|uniref:Uncharacterized protein n=2 Tax=Eucalyptus grandis TaxID=71139 RepID=A0ACC3LS86_EUCGR|nr:hypothetical protein EUGRSUZ_B01719 [Eucalyptus grandis]